MVRKMLRAAALAAVIAVGVVLSFGALTAANTAAEKPTIDAIMKANHNKKAGSFPKIQALVKEGKLADAAPLAKALATNGAALVETKPEKGDEKSWATLAKAYAASTKAVADAIDKKDAKAASAAVAKVGGTCKACHDAHR